MLKATVMSAAAAALLSGCSTLFEGKYDFRDGWRRGKVERIVSGEAVQQPRYWRCTRGLSPGELAGHRYVILTYQVPSRGGVRRHLVTLPPDLNLHPGQLVYVNAFLCQDAMAVPAGLPHAEPAEGRG
ncbi:hypothetical protein GCM10028796_05020 [Ramlibacter monticola]